MKNAVNFTAVAILVGFALPTVAEAAIINGGFEDGLTGWEALGDYRVESSSFGSGPVKGNSQAFLSTAFNEAIDVDENGNDIVGGNAACASFISNFCENSLEQFFDVSTFQGDTFLDSIATAEPLEGSAIKQTFAAQAGQKLSFSWNFLTEESTEQAARDDSSFPDFNDLAFVTIQSDSSSDLFSLADTISTFSDSATSFGKETGFRTFSYTIPTQGDYTLGIGVVDVGEPTRISGLLIDNAVAVPETDSTLGTLGMLFLGGCWTVAVHKRRQRKRCPVARNY